MSESNQIKVRSSNLELLRIVAMLGIVLSHYHFYLGNLIASNPTSSMSIYHYAIGMGGKIGINIFMLITGYFMCLQDISLKKYLKLLLMVYFYNIIIQGSFMLFGDYPINSSTLLTMFFPFRKIHPDSFITDFLWFYLFIPFVSLLVKNMTRQQHLKLIVLSLIMFVGYNSIPGFSTEISPVTWFAVIMLVASYVRIYDPAILKRNSFVWMGMSVFMILCAFASIIILGKIGYFPKRFTESLNSPLGFLIAFAVFMTFLTMKIPYNKWINLYGGAAFGVLLIHSNCWPIRELIFKEIVDTQRFFIEGNMWIPIVTCVSIYIVCGTIEILRQTFIEPPLLNCVFKAFRIK